MVANIAESDKASAQLKALVDRGLVPRWGSSPVSIRVRKADYSYRQLAAWRNAVRLLGRLPALQTRTLDLDEVRNRVVVGVAAASEFQRQAVSASLAQLNIPSDGVVIEVVGPVQLDLCHAPDVGTIEQRQRPLEGGRQLSWSSPSACATLGYTALYDGLKYGVTNSHVTATLWTVGAPPREFFQGTVPGSRIGVESLDPPPSGQCVISQTYDCRGDVAMIRIDDSVQVEIGAIARTTSRNAGENVAVAGSKTIDPQKPHFWIRDVIRVLIGVGTPVNKIGITTGWTWGKVTNSCVDVYSPQQGWTPFYPGSATGAVVSRCTYLASYYGDGGDSGAPVFTWSGDPQNTITAAGIHWGHTSSPLRGYFTPYEQIERDFGGLHSRRLQIPYPVGTPDLGFSYVDGGSPHLTWAATQNASYYEINRCVEKQDGVGCLYDFPITTTATSYYETREPAVNAFSMIPYPSSSKYVKYWVTAFAANGVFSASSIFAYFKTSGSGGQF